LGQTFLDLSGDIKTGELFTRLTRNRLIILLSIFLLATLLALVLALYSHPEIKDNPLFVALSFVATVFPCLYLLLQISKSDSSEQKQRVETTEEKVLDTNPSLHQIPPPAQDFIGRKDDIDQIMNSFDRGATITGLRGMGGVGKTALALILAERLKDRFPDGQLFLDMQGTGKNPLKPEDAMAHIIRSYQGADAKVPKDLNGLSGLYHSVLFGKKVLILLDNVASKEQVELLLPPIGCALLVTSRKKFALPGLREKDLDVLPLDKAKKLLLEIADRIGEHAEGLAKLCGCLPIALRNAAYALKESPNMSPEGYIKRLADASKRLELVEASFTTSYDLLTPKLQRLWSLLSVFPAEFDLAGAAAIWEMEEVQAGDALGELIRWSLVDFLPSATGEGGRYKLHDLARDFADSRLDKAARDPAKLRHAEHYIGVLALANETFMQGKESTLKGLQLFDQEWANILAGQSWAKENLEGNSSAIELCKSYPSAGAYVLDLRLSPLDRISWLKAALMACRLSNDKTMEGGHLGNLGLAYSDLGETRKAIEFYEQALVIAREVKDRGGEETHLGNLGNAYLYLAETRKAIEFFEQALVIAREIKDRRGEGAHLGNLGNACLHLGETGKAIEFYEQALVIAREIKDRRGEGANLGNLGDAYLHLGETRKAIEFYEQALVIAQEIKDRLGEGGHLGNLGLAYTVLGETRKAIEFYELALVIAREIKDRRGEGAHLGYLGLAYYHLGEPRKAIEFYEKSLAILREIEDKRGEGSHLGNMGNAYNLLGEPRKAIEFYEKSLAILREIEDKRGEGSHLGNMGNAYNLLGEPRKAIEFYEQALAISREIGDLRGEGNQLFNMSLSLQNLGQQEKAISLARSALAIFEQIESPHAETVRQKLAEWGA
jgi:tetratricopeptide (TPR) repeat protein